MDRARSLGCGVARYPARKGELPEEPAEPVLAQADLRIDLAVGAFEVGVRHDPRATVAWTGHVNRVQATPADRAVQVRVDQVQARGRAEVAEQPWLHVLRLERLAQERVVEKVDLSDREVVGGPPVRVDPAQLLGGKRVRGLGRERHGQLRSKMTRP